mgnify:CR=1 FL=1
MECNKEQEEAIMHWDGPAMVLAGPGAGKTYVITNRVKALIDEYGVKPEQILVVTFSKAAAVEMKERFEMLTGGQSACQIWNVPFCFFSDFAAGVSL